MSKYYTYVEIVIQTMRGRRVLLVKIVIIFFEQSLATTLCDMETGIVLDEGNMGQSEDFNWLGILKVYLNDDDSEHVAVTGLVLVKPKHALANADDIVKIPKRIFETETQAMFITDGDIPVHYAPVSYVTHPEYETSTFNTIAVIELNVGEDSPLIPICFPIVSYDSSYLYLIAYTDENDILEKMIYRIQYIDKQDCEEFYQREGLTDKSREPTEYICGKLPHTRSDCVWTNGLVLVSNSSGWFTLIGFSVHGPGCAAPARFINMPRYLPWVESVTREKNSDYDYYDNRRANDLDMEFVPIHRTFTSYRQGKPAPPVPRYDYLEWPFFMEKPKYFNIEPSYDDEGVIAIYPFNTTQEMYVNSCKKFRTLMYREYFEVKARKNSLGTVTYKLSLYDLVHRACSCVTLTVDCTNRTLATIAFKEVFVFASEIGDPGAGSGATSPPDVFIHYPVTERGDTYNNSNFNASRNPNLRPAIIQQSVAKGNVLNYDLYIKFDFNTSAVLKFEMFATPKHYNTSGMGGGRRKGLSKDRTPKRKKMPYWGLSQAIVDKTVKEPILVIEHEDVQETVSEARRSAARVLVVLGSLVCVCSTRAVFVN